MALLPPTAIEYIERLLRQEFERSRLELSQRVREFSLQEATDGRSVGPGYAARLRPLFVETMKQDAQVIKTCLLKGHQDFQGDTSQEVEEQLLAIASQRLEQSHQALRDWFVRYLEGRGMRVPEDVSALMIAQAAPSQAALPNGLREHFWIKRNVPMADTKMPGGQTNVTINVNGGTGHAVAVGDGASASAALQQQWTQQDIGAVVEALIKFREAVNTCTDVDDATRESINCEVGVALADLQEHRDPSRLAQWLSGAAMTVQTVAALSGAWTLLKQAAAAVGQSLTG